MVMVAMVFIAALSRLVSYAILADSRAIWVLSDAICRLMVLSRLAMRL